MIHPLVRLIVTEPHLVTQHLGNYVALLGTETQRAKSEWTLRLLLTIFSGVCAILALALAGVALMLWAVTPAMSQHAEWVLCATPAVPAVAALFAGLAARRPSAQRAFASVKDQLSADVQMLKEVSAP